MPNHGSRRLLALADCENEIDAVKSTLRFAGLTTKDGRLKARSKDACIIQTGDLLYKQAPDPSVVDYWQALQADAEARGCSLILLAGNHELEIWQRLQAGQDLGLKRHQQETVKALIRGMRLIHVEGSILFIHGYPTLKLLEDIRQYRETTGEDINAYNEHRYRPTLEVRKRLMNFAYRRGDAARQALLHDVQDPQRYYRQRGREVAMLLGKLGIDIVVHGHRPERSGMQTDFELRRWLPGVRMISNDTQMAQHGLGATVIAQPSWERPEVILVNSIAANANLRRRVRRLMRSAPAPRISAFEFPHSYPHRWEPHQSIPCANPA